MNKEQTGLLKNAKPKKARAPIPPEISKQTSLKILFEA